MRILAACTDCKRQYEVRDLRPGERFHCACGAVVTIPQDGELHTNALHCSGCGAGRQADAASCGFCGTAYAAEDVQRRTICPTCFSRITDQARFCDHCGTGIDAVHLAGETTRLQCPICPATHLHHRPLPGAATGADECPTCTGMWLEAGRFQALLDTTQASVLPGSTGTAAATGTKSPLAPQAGPLYRNCPVCAQMMNRRNFALSSGVIVDSCKDHGTWFDADELARIIRFVQDGGLNRARERDRQREAGEARRAAARPAPAILPLDASSSVGRGSSGVDIVATVIDVFASLFSR